MKKRIMTALTAGMLMLTGLAGCSDGDSSSGGEQSSAASVTGTEAETGTTTSAPEEVTTLPITLQPSSEPDSSQDDSQAAAEPADISPAMWEFTTDDGVKVTMLAAMHSLKEECFPLPDYIMDAFNSADVLVNECDMTTATSNFAVQLEELKNMYYADGDSLENHISADTYQKLLEFGTKFNADLSYYSTCKSWVIMALLEQMVLSQIDLNPNLSADMTLTQLAHDNNKEIYELESAMFQVQLYLGLSDEICENLIRGYVDVDLDECLKGYVESYEAWKTGDLQFFEDMYDIEKIKAEAEKAGTPLSDKQAELTSLYNSQMVFDRNLGMRDKLKELISSGKKNIFVAIGEAHFVGEKGLIALLKAEGYDVKRVDPAGTESKAEDTQEAA